MGSFWSSFFLSFWQVCTKYQRGGSQAANPGWREKPGGGQSEPWINVKYKHVLYLDHISQANIWSTLLTKCDKEQLSNWLSFKPHDPVRDFPSMCSLTHFPAFFFFSNSNTYFKIIRFQNYSFLETLKAVSLALQGLSKYICITPDFVWDEQVSLRSQTQPGMAMFQLEWSCWYCNSYWWP